MALALVIFQLLLAQNPAAPENALYFFLPNGISKGYHAVDNDGQPFAVQRMAHVRLDFVRGRSETLARFRVLEPEGNQWTISQERLISSAEYKRIIETKLDGRLLESIALKVQRKGERILVAKYGTDRFLMVGGKKMPVESCPPESTERPAREVAAIVNKVEAGSSPPPSTAPRVSSEQASQWRGYAALQEDIKWFLGKKDDLTINRDSVGDAENKREKFFKLIKNRIRELNKKSPPGEAQGVERMQNLLIALTLYGEFRGQVVSKDYKDSWEAILFWVMKIIEERVKQWQGDKLLRPNTNHLEIFVDRPAGAVLAPNQFTAWNSADPHNTKKVKRANPNLKEMLVPTSEAALSAIGRFLNAYYSNNYRIVGEDPHFLRYASPSGFKGSPEERKKIVRKIMTVGKVPPIRALRRVSKEAENASGDLFPDENVFMAGW